MFSNVYISVNSIFECFYLFFGWEIRHPLSTYAIGRMNGVIQNVYRCVLGEGGGWKLVIRYVRTKWMATNKCCGMFLCIGLAKYTRASPPARKMSLFSSIVITITLSYAIIRIWSISSIFKSPQKNRHSIFLCLKFLCDAKLITTLLIFQFLVKIWSENSISVPVHSRITYFWIWLFGETKYKGGDAAEARGTDEQPLYDKPPLMLVEKLTVPGSNNLKAQHKVLCKRDERKICYVLYC